MTGAQTPRPASSAERVLAEVLERLPRSDRWPLVPDVGEILVPATAIEDPAWLADQLRLRGERWKTDDRRVLATLWWYSASLWIVGPTLSSLATGARLLSGDLDDLDLHWLPDSRLTGSTSSRVLHSGPGVATSDRIVAAGNSLRGTYDRVIPLVAASARIAARPLWAIAADALATRLLSLGRSLDTIEAVVALLDPLADAIGAPLPHAHYRRDGAEVSTLRCSCCLIYLVPGEPKCSGCPRRNVETRRAQNEVMVISSSASSTISVSAALLQSTVMRGSSHGDGLPNGASAA